MIVRRSLSLLLALGLTAGAGAHAAEAVKLRPLPPIWTDGTGSTLSRPEGVACGQGVVVVADSANRRLVRYTITEARITPDPQIELPSGLFPKQVALDSKGGMRVLDGRSRRIARLAPNGALSGWIDPGAGGVGGTVLVQAVRVGGDDRLYLLDAYGARVVVLDAAGALLREIAYPDEYGFFEDLAVDARGVVFAIDSVGKQLYVASPQEPVLVPLGGSLAEDLDFPAGVAVDDRGHIFVGDQNGGGVVVLGSDGSFRGRQSGWGWKQGLLRYPSQLCLIDGATLFVADRQNNRVQPFTVVQ